LNNSTKEIDVLCVGEVLIDFIGHQERIGINETRDYHRYLGGSPTNVAMNTSRLGLNTVLIATMGKDGFADYIMKRLNAIKINIDYVKISEEEPTSTIFVSKTTGTPDFIPYRKADSLITEDQIPSEILSKTKIYHTTCFALSTLPARDTILKKAKEAYNLGCKLSIDVNYSPKIWKDRVLATEVIKEYCSYNPLVKISEDDMRRLFNKEQVSHKEIFTFFHDAGVDIVCLTLGKDGVKLSEKGKEIISLPAIKIVRVMDATGAGDAFWSGFLFAYINNNSLKECLDVALKLAALKLQNVGRLPDNINILSQLLK